MIPIEDLTDVTPAIEDTDEEDDEDDEENLTDVNLVSDDTYWRLGWSSNWGYLWRWRRWKGYVVIRVILWQMLFNLKIHVKGPEVEDWGPG